VSEAWVSVTHKDRLADTTPAKDPPARREALAISSYEPGTRQTDLMLYEMVRDEDGVLREVRDFEIEGVGEDTESPLLEAFVVGYTGDITSLTDFPQHPAGR
jgi:hypothetical protein